MKELIEKGIVTTLGATKLAFEMVQDVVKEMIEAGKMTAEDGEHFLSNLSEKVEKEKNELKDKLSGRTGKGFASKITADEKEIADIKHHISRIEERLTKLENPLETFHPEQEPQKM